MSSVPKPARGAARRSVRKPPTEVHACLRTRSSKVTCTHTCAEPAGQSKGKLVAAAERLQMGAVDSAVRLANSVIASTSKDRSDIGGTGAMATAPSALRSDAGSDDDLLAAGGGMAAAPAQEVVKRRIVLSAQSSVQAPVKEVEGRPLAEYLALPVDEYNLLDEDIVQRLDEHRFQLTFPFKRWFRLDVTPQVVLSIRPEPAKERVMFMCESMKFGQVDIDSDSSITFGTAVSRAAAPSGGLRRGAAARTADGEVPDSVLVSAMQFSATLDVPARGGSLVPVGTMEALGNRIIAATLQACAKPFVDSLAADYADWAHGRARKVGSISAQDLDAAILAVTPQPRVS